jgi:hypothetical protein
MWQQLYSGLTVHEGMYLFYSIPIVYFFIIIFRTIITNIKHYKEIGLQEVLAAVAILLLLLDFVMYLYLLLSKSGTVLPMTKLFIKYVVGFFLWIWALWYSYTVYFARPVAREHFTRRRSTLLGLCVGSLVLGGFGFIIS